MNSQSITDRGASLNTCIEDAVEAFQVSGPEELAVNTWEQIFSSTTCGFKGVGGQAMTRALVVMLCPLDGNGHDGPIRVYMNSKFAYQIERPNDVFIEDMLACKLMDQAHYGGQYSV